MPQQKGRGFASMDEEEHREISRRGGQASHGGQGEEDQEEESGRGNNRASGQSAKRVISRAVRVLNEIESRISELKEELEEQEGQSGGEGGGSRGGRSGRQGFASMDPEQQREIASMGGRASHGKGNAHEFDSEEAAEAGRQSHKNR